MKPTAVVVGVGAMNGLGAAICQRFAREGHHVIVAGRTLAKLELVLSAIHAEHGSAEAVVCDATQPGSVQALFDKAMAPGAGRAPVSVVVFNAGNNAPIPLRDVTPEQFEDFWRIGCFAGFIVGSEAARRMVPLGRGSILFTGASGSMRGRAAYGHFAAAKAGLRMLTQSMAREFGPLGVHVAHVVVDGGIDGDRLRSLAPHRVEQLGDDGLLNIDAIADAYWFLHRQPRSAWTQELDLRPFKESF